MRIYSVETCLLMIAHYERQAKNQDKPQHWRDLCLLSAATWKQALENSFKNNC